MTSYAEFARWLRVQLAERGWKQVELAKRSELLGETVTQTTVSKWTRGETQPTRENCAMLAQILDVPMDEVIALAGHPALQDPILPGLSRRLARLPEDAREGVVERVEAYADSLLASFEGGKPRTWAMYDGERGVFVTDRHRLVDLIGQLSDENVVRFLSQVESAIADQ